MNQEQLTTIRAAFQASEAAVPLNSTADVIQHFGQPSVGTPASHLGERLKVQLLAAPDPDFTSLELRQCANTFKLERAIGSSTQRYDAVLEKMAEYVPAGKPLTPPTHANWQDMATVGRALAILEPAVFTDKRAGNVAKAVAALTAKGFKFALSDDRIARDSPGYADATARIMERLQRVGLVEGMTRLFSGISQSVVYNFDQYLFGRHHDHLPMPRDPTYPWAFILNLVARLPDVPPEADADAAWSEAVTLARDLAATLDVETYSAFAFIGVAPKILPRLMGDFGLHDHLFGMRQWSRALTPHIMEQVFTRKNDVVLSQKLGWTIQQAALLADNLGKACGVGVSRVTKKQLASNGLSQATLDKMLPHLTHQAGQPNQTYASPVDAPRADLMFRPLIALADGSFLVPSASLAGPAYYEAIATALRSTIGSQATNALTGEGTERMVGRLLQLRGIRPTCEGAKYNSTKQVDAGECDFVLEDDQYILFIECKSKALTRATMAGEPVDALIDYARSMLASQAQALQHERVLRANGQITFDDGHVLTLGGRKVVRLTVTLLDHGSFQDRVIFSQFALPVLSARIKYDPGHTKARMFDDVNDDLKKLTDEMEAAAARTKNVWVETLGSASLSVGQLAVLLDESPTVSELVKRLTRPVTFSTTNPLLEYHHLRNRGLG